MSHRTLFIAFVGVSAVTLVLLALLVVDLFIGDAFAPGFWPMIAFKLLVTFTSLLIACYLQARLGSYTHPEKGRETDGPTP